MSTELAPPQPPPVVAGARPTGRAATGLLVGVLAGGLLGGLAGLALTRPRRTGCTVCRTHRRWWGAARSRRTRRRRGGRGDAGLSLRLPAVFRE